MFSPQTVIGPGNVISGNLRGVHISGAAATQAAVRDNLIGTDITGKFDLGNALEGVRIDDATDAVVTGDARGSQVISGNHQGVVIAGASSTRNLVAGNLIGSDKSGLAAMPNAQEGVRIDGAPRQHDRRDHFLRTQPDLGQPLGRAARRGRCHGEPRRGELTSAPTSPARPRWAARSTA